MRYVMGLTLVFCMGCGSQAEPTGPQTLQHTFDELDVGAYSETEDWCQSWSLDNDEPLHVNSVHMIAGPGFHHSNWFYVPDDGTYPTNTTFDCGEMGFDQLTAAVTGGVFFAQSTQATDETMQFVDGAAIVVPPHSMVVGNLHILNALGEPITTSIAFEVHTLAQGALTTPLRPLALDYHDLDIPPLAQSRFTGTCDVRPANGGNPVDFNFYYVLPHYHALGTGMRFTAIHESGEQLLFENNGAIGEPLSKVLDPPLSAAGAESLRFSCNYNNTTDSRVGQGIGDQEMCIIVAFTDAPVTFGGGVFGGNTVVGSTDGVVLNEGDCAMISSR